MELSEIKGLKDKRIEKLKSSGIFKPEDLILRFPYIYIDKNATIDFQNLNNGDEIAFIGKITGQPVRKFIRKGLSFVKAKFEIQGKEITCTWFNQPYIFKMLIAGNLYTLCGKVKKFKSSIEISAPQIKSYVKQERNIIPLYKSINGLPYGLFSEAVKIALDSIKIDGLFDNFIREKYNLMTLDEAVRTLHFPDSIKSIETASYSAALENLCCTICKYNLLKQQNSGLKTFKYDEKYLNSVENFIKNLPYKLTSDQKAAIKTIFESMNSDKKMNKLIQGDVGCGKTIVAFAAMYYAALNGYQCALMAPTEILAKQHYSNALNIFKDCGINIEFLSGSLSKSVKDTAVFNIKNGVANIVIGTHSLISESISFYNLSLVITDEQQRFGVSQRGALENKTKGADTIVMSATPIPRTLALSFYGDLDQVIIKTMPAMKAKIFTRFVPQNKINDMIQYLKKCAENNLQTYIVCPRIEDDEKSETENIKEIYSKFSPVFGEKNCGLLHGVLKDYEKNSIMQSFLKGDTKILFSTTIIEVGIDVPQAVNIVIFNGERYGLSQLHQLRGRVGRGTTDSYCFVLSDFSDEITKKRLEYFINCADGFELAEYDLSVRGAGDFLGEKQHGGDGFNTKFSVEMLKIAKEISDYLLNAPQIVNKINENLSREDSEYLYNLTIN